MCNEWTYFINFPNVQISRLLTEERYLDNETLILTHLYKLRKSSQKSRGRNPSDLAADIEAVRLLVRAQNMTLDQPEMSRIYPTYDNTTDFAKVCYLL